MHFVAAACKFEICLLQFWLQCEYGYALGYKTPDFGCDFVDSDVWGWDVGCDSTDFGDLGLLLIVNLVVSPIWGRC